MKDKHVPKKTPISPVIREDGDILKQLKSLRTTVGVVESLMEIMFNMNAPIVNTNSGLNYPTNMKKSVVTRDFSLTGAVKVVKAQIIVTMNDSCKVFLGTHAVTHDDYEKNIYSHKIVVRIDDQLWKSVDVHTEEAVLDYVKNIMVELKQEMSHRANTVPAKTFEEKLNDILNS